MQKNHDKIPTKEKINKKSNNIPLAKSNEAIKARAEKIARSINGLNILKNLQYLKTLM